MNRSSSTEAGSLSPKQAKMNRIVYGVFTLAGIVFALMKDWNNAIIFFGLAPVFDPFGPLAFRERPRWQRVWLYVHVALTLIVLGLSLSKLWT
jgi:hypothetical protein